MISTVHPRLARLYQTAANLHRSGLKPYLLGTVLRTMNRTEISLKNQPS